MKVLQLHLEVVHLLLQFVVASLELPYGIGRSVQLVLRHRQVALEFLDPTPQLLHFGFVLFGAANGVCELGDFVLDHFF